MTTNQPYVMFAIPFGQDDLMREISEVIRRHSNPKAILVEAGPPTPTKAVLSSPNPDVLATSTTTAPPSATPQTFNQIYNDLNGRSHFALTEFDSELDCRGLRTKIVGAKMFKNEDVTVLTFEDPPLTASITQQSITFSSPRLKELCEKSEIKQSATGEYRISSMVAHPARVLRALFSRPTEKERLFSKPSELTGMAKGLARTNGTTGVDSMADGLVLVFPDRATHPSKDVLERLGTAYSKTFGMVPWTIERKTKKRIITAQIGQLKIEEISKSFIKIKISSKMDAKVFVAAGLRRQGVCESIKRFSLATTQDAEAFIQTYSHELQRLKTASVPCQAKQNPIEQVDPSKPAVATPTASTEPTLRAAAVIMEETSRILPQLNPPSEVECPTCHGRMAVKFDEATIHMVCQDCQSVLQVLNTPTNMQRLFPIPSAK